MATLENQFLKLKDIKVIDSTFPYSQYIPIDLTVSNTNLSAIDIHNSEAFEDFIENYLQENKAKVAYGGYNEERNLYNRNFLFGEEKTTQRNIHIGIDLWVKAGTPVLAALEGTVHSFDYNVGIGDYGPTIILKHQLEGIIFYTLYGHLSIESIETLKIGVPFKRGEKIAELGDASVNGDYSPHLHFQIIKNIKDHSGDYPGVCSKNDRDYYLENCPDPNLLLKIE